MTASVTKLVSSAGVAKPVAKNALDSSIPAESLGLPQWIAWWSVVGEGRCVRLPNGKFTKALKLLLVAPIAAKIWCVRWSVRCAIALSRGPRWSVFWRRKPSRARPWKR